jgi:PAS domain S-box-containing protein
MSSGNRTGGEIFSDKDIQEGKNVYSMETGIKVLYVDDEPGLLEIARLFLEETGNFQVFTSTSAKESLASSPILSYDAIISDYQMPGMDGIAFLKEVRHRYGDMPFILFTGRGREEVVIEAINNGADFYLQKGGDPTAQFAELGHKIRQAVARKRAELSRIKAESSLRESEEKYRSLIDLVPLAVLVHRQGKIIYANPECVRLSGARHAEELIGKEILPLIHPDDRPVSLENFRQAGEGATIPLTETRLYTIDGRPFTVEAAGKQIIFEGLPSVIVVYRDITDRKKGEDELRAAYEQITASEEELRANLDEIVQAQEEKRKSEQNFRVLVDNAPDAIYIQTNTRFRYLNNAALRLLGASSADELLGKSMWDRIHPSFHERIRGRVKNLTVDQQPVGLLDEVYIKLDGTPVDVEVKAIPFQYEGELGVLVMLHDISARKRADTEIRTAYEQLAAAEEELREQYEELGRGERLVRESQVRLRTFMDSATDSYSIWDADLNLVDLNGAALSMLPPGIRKEDIIGRNLAELVSGSGEWNDYHRYLEVIKSGVPFTGTEMTPDPQFGRHWLNVKCFRVGDGLGIVTSDITREKEAEENLREAFEQLTASEEELRGQYEELALAHERIQDSEERSRKILEQVPLPLALVRNDGALTFVNDRFVRVFGYTLEDIPTLETWWQQAYPDPAYRNEVIRSWNEAVRRAADEKEDIRPGEYRVTCRSGEERITEISGIVLPDGFLATFIDNTERKRMDEALFTSQQMLQTVLDSIPQRVFWKDRNSVFLGCNLPLALDAGFSDPAKIVGKTDYDHASRATAELYRADDRQVMETGQPRINYEEPQVRPDGSPAWLRTSKVPLRDREGTIIGVMGTYEDITDQKKAQEKLRESEERYRSLVDSSFDGIAIHQEGVIVFANRTAARLLGYEDPSSLISKTVFDIVHPDERAWIAARMTESPEKPLDLVHEKFLRADGMYLHVDVATTPCTWKGQPAVYVTFRDISGQIKTEEALREKTEELDQFFMASLDLFCIAGMDGYFRRLNPEWEKTLGYTLTEMEGRRFLDFVHPDDLPATLAAVADLSHLKQVLNFTNRYRHKDGTYRWIEWRSFPSGERIFAAARDITGRKRIEEALRGSEERLRLFIEHAPAALAMLDTELRYIVASRRWMADYHLGDRDIIGHSHLEIFPELTEEIRDVLRRGLAGETTSAKEDKFERQDGSVQWLAWEVRPWYTAGHDIGGVIIFSEDVTQRKKAEEALRESEARLTSILHSSPVLQFVIGSDHRILSWNKALEEYSGIRAAEVIGTDEQWRAFYLHKRPVLADLLVDDNTDGLFKWYAGKLQPSRYVEGAYEATDFFPAMGASGTWLAFTAAPIRNTDGAITGAVETLEDVTERISATGALRASEEKYRHILENMQDAYIRADENGTITMVNPSAIRMYGYDSVAEMTGIPVDSLYVRSGEQRGDLLRKLKEAGGVTDFYGEARRKDGTILWVSVNAQYITDRDGRIRGTEGIVRDVTERKTMERAVREANRKLALLSSITRHDIKNQLLTLNGFIALLREKMPKTLQDDYFPRIMVASNNIQKMIQFTKEYEQIGVHAPAWQDLRTLVDTAGRDAVLGRLTLKNDIPAATEVFADPLIAKVIFNLVDNAVRHGGKITTIRFLLLEQDHGRVIVCEDDGNGIPEDEKEMIFDLGFGKNTGFGLSISREILDITGITIKESGEPGRGARFEIAIPEGHFRSVQ